MLMLISYSMMISLVVMLMLFLPMLLSTSTKKWFEKVTTFECGMNLSSVPRKPFSLQFFLLMILFIIFDIEIAFILAMPIICPWSSKITLFFIIFIMVLFMGLIYEWTEGSLNWKL